MDVFPGDFAAIRETSEPSSTQPASVTLPDTFIQALLYAAELKPSLYDSFEYYLDNGELEAASTLIEAAASAANISTMALQRRLGQQQQALEEEFARLRAQLQHFPYLKTWGELRLDEPDLARVRETADQLFERKRLGSANSALRNETKRLEAQVYTARERLIGEIAEVQGAVATEPSEELRIIVTALLERAMSHLTQDQLSLVRSTLQRARIHLETHDISLPTQSATDDHPVLSFRGRFPYLTAQELYAVITDADGGNAIISTKSTTQFNSMWRPSHWLPGKPPSQQDEVFQVLNALRQLSARKTRPPTLPFQGGERDYWSTFLPRLFRILGKEGLEPSSAEMILGSKHDSSGYWLARCRVDLSMPFSFVTPERLPNGLALIIWNRPDSAACPSPANLAEQTSTGNNRTATCDRRTRDTE